MNDNPDLLAVEEAIFNTLHASLWQNYPNQYVAISGTELVDHDIDLSALTQRIYQRFGDVPIWIAPVKESPVEEWIIRSPRLH